LDLGADEDRAGAGTEQRRARGVASAPGAAVSRQPGADLDGRARPGPLRPAGEEGERIKLVRRLVPRRVSIFQLREGVGQAFFPRASKRRHMALFGGANHQFSLLDQFGFIL
jgi:hypothetical protein